MNTGSFNYRSSCSRLGLAALLVLLGVGPGLIVGQVRAAGIPQEGALTYTGHLVDSEGVPFTGNKSLAVSVYNAASGGAALCGAAEGDVTVTDGRFQVPLPDACVDAVKEQADLWLEVSVDGESLARTKVGAVPFAVEAGHATLADSLTGSQSGFAATLSSPQIVSSETPTVMPFDTEVFDLGSEFDEASGAFVPNVAGYYSIACTLTFEENIPAYEGNYQVRVLVDGAVVATSGGWTRGTMATRVATLVTRLEAGAEVTCQANQIGSGLVRNQPEFSHFEGARLSISE